MLLILLLYRGCPVSEIKLYCHAPVGTTELILCREVKFTVTFISARNKDQELVGRFFEDGIFYRLLIAVPLKMYRKFGQPKWILVSQMLKLV